MLYPSYVYVTKTNQLVGSAVEPANTLVAVDSTVRDAFVAAGQGDAVDQLLTDLAKSGLSTAAVALNFTGTTPITVDLNALAAATGVQVAGATTFANFWNHLLFQNIGAASNIAISLSASDPINSQLGGTGPTVTLKPGDFSHWYSAAGQAVSTTHCNVTFTPTAGGTLLIGIAGS